MINGEMAEQQELAPKGAAKKKEPSWGEPRILEALRERYAAPAFAYFPHVRNQTGYGRVTRTADAIAMSLFPSRGLHLTGVEVKSDRGDWVRELKDPSKAEEIAAHCDFWVLAVGDREIVRTGELPTGWGMLAPSSGKLKLFVEPKLLGERDDRISRRFLAAILRRAMEDSPAEHLVKAAVEAAREQWHKAKAERDTRESTYELSHARSEVADLRRRITEFEAASGIDIGHGYSMGRIGEAVRALANSERTDRLADQLEASARTLADAAAEVRKIPVGPRMARVP
jgi:hypothetical protein